MDVDELLEDRGVRRIAGLRLAALRQLELAEQDVPELLRRSDRELVADGVDRSPRSRRVISSPELAVEQLEGVEIDGNADRLHPGEDGDERQLHVDEQPLEPPSSRSAVARRLTGRERGESFEARAIDGGQLLARRQDQIQALRDDIRDGLRPERGVQQVGGDLGVEGHRRRRPGRSSVPNRATSNGFASWATIGTPVASSRPRSRSPSSAPRPRRRARPFLQAQRPASSRARGRGSSLTRAAPTIGCSAIQARSPSRSRRRHGPRSALGSAIVAARAVARSSNRSGRAAPGPRSCPASTARDVEIQ